MTTRDEIVDIAVDDSHIAGTVIASASRLPGVLFVHGWGGNQTQYIHRAREVAALGCVCLTFDLRGHAQSEQLRQTVSREDNLRDALAAYDALVARPNVDPAAIAVVGSSYGAYLAAILSSLRPVRWLALRAPALYKDDDWALPKLLLSTQQDLANYRQRRIPPAENRALQAGTTFDGDMLLVESEHDHLVPHAVIVNYREAYEHAHSLTYRVIEGADHALSEESAQKAYTSLLVNWLTEMLVGARQEPPPPGEQGVSPFPRRMRAHPG
jgi:uncharacterized protein